MPRMDGTGPLGQGPMTGRGLGPCGNGGIRVAQANQPQSSWFSGLWSLFRTGNYNGGTGAGGGRGRGAGRRQARGGRRAF